MKNLLVYISIFLLVIAQMQVFAQPENSFVAPDFTLYDIDGNAFNLYEQLDANKPVVLDFFAVWCGTCQENVVGLNKLNNQFGSNGDNSIVVLGLEGDENTSNEELDEFIETYNANYQHINETANVTDLYGVGYFPMIFLISPDRSFVEIGASPADLYNTLLAELQNCVYLSETQNDARLLEYLQPIGNHCFGAIYPKLSIQNYGQQVLNSVDILMKINDVEIENFHWQGNLASYEFETIQLDTIEFSEYGNYNFQFVLQNPNETSDDNTENNSQAAEFQIDENSFAIMVSLITDTNPEEINWIIWENNNNILEGSGYSEINSLYEKEFCANPESCYKLSIYDNSGNGFNFPAKLELVYNNVPFVSINSEQHNTWATHVEFCTADLFPPQITTFPENNASEIPVNESFVIISDKKLQLYDGSELNNANLQEVIKLFNNNNLDETLELNFAISNDYKTITISPFVNLLPNSNFLLMYENGLTDIFSQAVLPFQISFSTNNLVVAQVSFLPTDNSGNVNPTAELYINFSTEVRLLGGENVTNSNLPDLISLETINNQPVEFVATVENNATSFVVQPISPLLPQTDYIFSLRDGLESTDAIAVEAQSISFTTGSFVAVENRENFGFLVFPNPTEQYLYISHSTDYTNYTNYTINIYSLDNRLLESINNCNQNIVKIDVTKFSAGIYFVELQTDTKNFVRKIVIL